MVYFVRHLTNWETVNPQLNSSRSRKKPSRNVLQHLQFQNYKYFFQERDENYSVQLERNKCFDGVIFPQGHLRHFVESQEKKLQD